MENNNSLILVSGGTGFLGAYVIRELLNKGYRVRALRRPGSSLEMLQGLADKVEWAEADVTDIIALEEAFTGVTEVFHCAAMVSFHPRDKRRMMQVNIEGTANMVNLSLEAGVRKFIHVSSIAALGRSKERTHLDENSKWVHSKDNTRYAISKYLSEQEVWRGKEEGLKVGIVNPSIILGSGYWNDGSAKFFKQVHEGLKFWPPGRSGFVDVRDVALFMRLLMESKISGERYVLNAENIAFRDFFNQIASELNAKPPFVKVTPFLAEVAWRVEWLKEKILGAEPIVTRESARSSLNFYTYGNEKSLQLPDFKYRPLMDTIRETAAKFLETREQGFGVF